MVELKSCILSCALSDAVNNIFDRIFVKSVCIKLLCPVSFLILCLALKADPVIPEYWVSQGTVPFLNGEALFLYEQQ